MFEQASVDFWKARKLQQGIMAWYKKEETDLDFPKIYPMAWNERSFSSFFKFNINMEKLHEF